MSLLLKALKQAETANALKPGGADSRIDGDIELEPLTEAGTAQGREWVEPPSLLFGNAELTPEPAHIKAPAFRWPQLSLVPLTALLAAIIALGYGIYLYFALQPPATVNQVAVSTVVADAPKPLINPTLTGPLPANALPAALPSPALPSTENSTTTVAAKTTSSAPTQPTRVALPPSAPPARLPLFQPDAQTSLLSQAYAAYQRGALTEAKRLYTQAAARGRNVDALLGLAAIASVQNREADAQRFYREVLDIDPRNAAAQGALLDLLGNTDNQATESRLKILIERDPNPQLYQTLGNLYAEQGRWSDAQPAYFEAWRGAPGNADYLYNLAVSLDQLQQAPAALTYYEKALAIGGTHRFDRAQAEARVQQLKSVR